MVADDRARLETIRKEKNPDASRDDDPGASPHSAKIDATSAILTKIQRRAAVRLAFLNEVDNSNDPP